MNRTKSVTCAAAVAAAPFLLIANPALAKEDKPLSLELSVGAEYDSNVSVDQVDVTTREGDMLAVLGARAKYKAEVGGETSIKLGYEFEQTLHEDFTGFDMQTHTLSAGADTKLGGIGLGADYSFYHILLGGDGFLDMHQVGPSLSAFVTDKVYLRVGYTYFDKDFKVADGRDASNHQVTGDVYYFFKDSKAYVSLGGRYETENTADPAFDYDGFQLSANVQLPVALWSRSGKIKFGYSYRERDYDNVTPSIGVRRHENRSMFRANAELPLTDHLSFKPEYRYVDRNSNYALSNYTEHVANGSFSYRF